MRSVSDGDGEVPCLLFTEPDTDDADGVSAHQTPIRRIFVTPLNPLLRSHTHGVRKVFLVRDDFADQGADAQARALEREETLANPNL